jgi:ubiquitin carboxyl-terminal hydrolase 7
MPTRNDSSAEPSIFLALQRLFYRLQFDEDAVDTRELTKSFGWDSGYLLSCLPPFPISTPYHLPLTSPREVFSQHDAQELSRQFLDILETKMKGTKHEGYIEKMLRGTESTVIDCTKVKFSASRDQPFYGK